MKDRFMKISTFCVWTTLLLVCFSFSSAFGAETPPEPYRTAPIIPYAKSVGEHRFRSPRNFEDTLEYYRKVFRGEDVIEFEKIINNSGVRGVFMKNKIQNGRWEGINIYEYKGSTVLFVVFTDKELTKIAAEKEKKNKKKKTPETH
jgi:hypothetical protein